MFILEGRTCERCAWSDARDRDTGQSAIRLKCRNPDVLRQSGETEPVSVLFARVTYCPPDSTGGPHWADQTDAAKEQQ